MKKYITFIIMVFLLVACKERESDFYLYDCPESVGNIEIDLSAVDIKSVISDIDKPYTLEMDIELRSTTGQKRMYRINTPALTGNICGVPVGSYILSCDLYIDQFLGQNTIIEICRSEEVEIVANETVKITPSTLK